MRKIVAMAALMAGAAIFAAPASAAVTVGNAPVAAPVVDGCAVCTFVLNDAIGQAGLEIGSFSFYANNASNITPLLLTRTDVGTVANFTVVAIGQLRNAALGLNTFAFNTAQGVNLTATNSYFGFAYGNGGVVALAYAPPSPTSGAFVGPENYAPTLGGTFSSDFSSQPANAYGALNARTYSIQATAVPEPATWAMMIGGVGFVGGAMRRRQKERATVALA